MSDMNFTIQSGESKRFLTGGKYNPNNIVVTAEGGGGGGSSGIELIETITLTEDTSSIVREFMPDGTPYAFKTIFAMIGQNQEWTNKWVKTTAYYNTWISDAAPYLPDETTKFSCYKAFSISGTKNIALRAGVLEIDGVITSVMSYGGTNPGYHIYTTATIASRIAFNINKAKINKFELSSEVPLVAGTPIYLYGVRA